MSKSEIALVQVFACRFPAGDLVGSNLEDSFHWIGQGFYDGEPLPVTAEEERRWYSYRPMDAADYPLKLPNDFLALHFAIVGESNDGYYPCGMAWDAEGAGYGDFFEPFIPPLQAEAERRMAASGESECHFVAVFWWSVNESHHDENGVETDTEADLLGFLAMGRRTSAICSICGGTGKTDNEISVIFKGGRSTCPACGGAGRFTALLISPLA